MYSARETAHFFDLFFTRATLKYPANLAPSRKHAKHHAQQQQQQQQSSDPLAFLDSKSDGAADELDLPLEMFAESVQLGVIIAANSSDYKNNTLQRLREALSKVRQAYPSSDLISCSSFACGSHSRLAIASVEQPPTLPTSSYHQLSQHAPFSTHAHTSQLGIIHLVLINSAADFRAVIAMLCRRWSIRCTRSWCRPSVCSSILRNLRSAQRSRKRWRL